MPGIVGVSKLGEDFGMVTNHFILVHDDLPASKVSALCDDIGELDGITQVVSLDAITGPGFPTEILPDGILEILQNAGYKLILANGAYKAGSDAVNAQVEQMIALVKAADPEGLVTGESAMTKDLVEIADNDFANVNVWSILAVLVIILISFRSLSIPVILVASIEAAIAINLGIPYFTGASLPFIASIILGTIQLGATVDYSILMTTRYREERALGRTPREAAPAGTGTLQPEHPHQRPDVLCRHIRRGCHQPDRADAEHLPAHLPGRAHQHGGHPCGAACRPDAAGRPHPPHHPGLAPVRCPSDV